MHLIKYIDPKPTPPIMRCMLLADRSKSLNFTNKGNVIRSLKLNRLKQDYLKLNHWQLPIGCPHFKSSPPVAPPLASVHRSLNHTRSTHNTRKKKVIIAPSCVTSRVVARNLQLIPALYSETAVARLRSPPDDLIRPISETVLQKETLKDHRPAPSITCRPTVEMDQNTHRLQCLPCSSDIK